ncbi:hypothetical protein CC85DRAFT_331518 [Cutaneotrichosporon oleaginosum]|uniref:Uncharacterized protein n=1 Tax=Cutaneotrichosporon oleaginosum TaxID=879819 RepID=A0A0J1AT88_9TREE|nr:uncharacterized protein CC85DRAFT_331518 [Cutaneotrichosporon oleaginosum]KLT38534.1 hypothetical protein CC85DRAFT_331518 [Cutaneotrichosporon oleaginosum]TXT08581.1 hypothetical protein COLE_05505 [Cutaneotrichosporon oleaginosum]
MSSYAPSGSSLPTPAMISRVLAEIRGHEPPPLTAIRRRQRRYIHKSLVVDALARRDVELLPLPQREVDLIVEDLARATPATFSPPRTTHIEAQHEYDVVARFLSDYGTFLEQACQGSDHQEDMRPYIHAELHSGTNRSRSDIVLALDSLSYPSRRVWLASCEFKYESVLPDEGLDRLWEAAQTSRFKLRRVMRIKRKKGQPNQLIMVPDVALADHVWHAPLETSTAAGIALESVLYPYHASLSEADAPRATWALLTNGSRTVIVGLELMDGRCKLMVSRPFGPRFNSFPHPALAAVRSTASTIRVQEAGTSQPVVVEAQPRTVDNSETRLSLPVALLAIAHRYLFISRGVMAYDGEAGAPTQ